MVMDFSGIYSCLLLIGNYFLLTRGKSNPWIKILVFIFELPVFALGLICLLTFSYGYDRDNMSLVYVGIAIICIISFFLSGLLEKTPQEKENKDENI